MRLRRRNSWTGTRVEDVSGARVLAACGWHLKVRRRPSERTTALVSEDFSGDRDWPVRERLREASAPPDGVASDRRAGSVRRRSTSYTTML